MRQNNNLQKNEFIRNISSIVRHFLYKYLPKWNWLQWCISLFTSTNHRWQRSRPGAVKVCLFICIGLMVLGFILMVKGIFGGKFFLVKGIEGIRKLLPHCSPKLLIRVSLVIFFCLV